MKRIIKLKGKHIGLAVLEKDDLKQFYEWVNDLEVSKYLTLFVKNITYEDELEWYEEIRKKSDQVVFSIIELKSGKVIGNTGLHDINHLDRVATFGIAILDKRFWSKGHGTEATTLMLDYGFNVLNLNSIMLYTLEDNARAQRVYEKVGFKRIGKRRQANLIGGEYKDDVYMDILAEEFNKKNRSYVKKVLEK